MTTQPPNRCLLEGIIPVETSNRFGGDFFICPTRVILALPRIVLYDPGIVRQPTDSPE